MSVSGRFQTTGPDLGSERGTPGIHDSVDRGREIPLIDAVDVATRSMTPFDITPQLRQRFEALRKNIFGESTIVTARWRVFWSVPYHVFVMLVLSFGGAPPVRIATQAAFASVIVGSGVRASAKAWRRAKDVPPIHGWASAAAMLGCIANTGGISSPLLLLIFPLLVGVNLTFEVRWKKRLYVLCVVAAVIAFGALANTPVGELMTPLAGQGAFSSPQYIALATGTAVYSLTILAMMGESFMGIYERAALELAARREELFHEGEERTLAFEGIAARLAHEVKNPLAAIKGLSAHVARNATDAKVAERLTIVAAEAERLQGIVEGFLSFSRGLYHLKLAAVRPFEVCRELVLLVEARATEADLVVEVAGDSSVVIEADARKLRQALLNLVVNAMHATPRGGGRRVRLVVSRGVDQGARIHVVDEGVGMTHEVIERIKKPYFTTREGGTGLGVAVARGIIEHHGGTMTYSSEPGRGTTVTIDLPGHCDPSGPKDVLPNPCRPND